MKQHGWWMVLGCVLPLVLIFVAPLLGIEGNWSLFLFISLMFFCHVGMMGHHGKHGDHDVEKEDDSHKTS